MTLFFLRVPLRRTRCSGCRVNDLSAGCPTQAGFAWVGGDTSVYACFRIRDYITRTCDRLHWQRRANPYTGCQRRCVSMPWWGRNGCRAARRSLTISSQ